MSLGYTDGIPPFFDIAIHSLSRKLKPYLYCMDAVTNTNTNCLLQEKIPPVYFTGRIIRMFE